MEGNITQEMIRRRSEHNECIVYTLEELVLQEEGIERIDSTLGTLCQHLKILYMPNNLIARLQNLHKLKELEYLNLAMNNIVKVEGLEKCEALQKLDLTLNFVDLQNLSSIMSLNANVHMKELFLTGNPCSDWDGFRSYVIAKLPHLKRLDAWDIKPRERIIALQEINHLEEDLEKLKNSSTHLTSIIPQENKSENGELRRDYTPETRLAEHRELQELRQQESMKGKYLDTTLIDIDVQPLLIRVLIKGKLLQLRLPYEVKMDASIAERCTTTGHLLVTMPLASIHVKATPNIYPNLVHSTPSQPKQPLQLKTVDIHNIVNGAASTDLLLPHMDSVHKSNVSLVPSPSCKLMDICDDDVPPLE